METRDEKIILKSRHESRTLSFYYLYVAESFEYAININDIVDMFETGFGIEAKFKTLALELAYKSITERDRLDKIIEPLLKNWKLDRLSVITRLILRMSIIEMEMGETPSSIVINEAIELAKCFAENDAYKFINGILDNIKKNLNISNDNE